MVTVYFCIFTGSAMAPKVCSHRPRMFLTGEGKVRTSQCYWTTLILESSIGEGRGITVGQMSLNKLEVKRYLKLNIKGELMRGGTGQPKSKVKPPPKKSYTLEKGKLLFISGEW